MKKRYSDIVEDVKKLDTHEKLQLRLLLDKYLIEERRKAFQAHYEESQNEESELFFTEDIDDLRNSVSE